MGCDCPALLCPRLTLTRDPLLISPWEGEGRLSVSGTPCVRFAPRPPFADAKMGGILTVRPLWIPAFAEPPVLPGHTPLASLRLLAPLWIPAFAGMTGTGIVFANRGWRNIILC